MNRDAGFTIVEALCAFAILALVLVALYDVAGTSSKTLVSATDHSRSVLLAESKLDEFAVMPAPLPKTLSGMIGQGDAKWRLKSQDMLVDKDAHTVLQEVRLTIEDSTSRSLVFETRHLGVLPR